MKAIVNGTILTPEGRLTGHSLLFNEIIIRHPEREKRLMDAKPMMPKGFWWPRA
ncbi:MAG: hypothetical protein ACOX6Y_11665 [Christensenellales bacterium]